MFFVRGDSLSGAASVAALGLDALPVLDEPLRIALIAFELARGFATLDRDVRADRRRGLADQTIAVAVKVYAVTLARTIRNAVAAVQRRLCNTRR